MLLSIVGPTAVGKTSFILGAVDRLLQETGIKGFDLISTDSRQVYQGLEIISGADVPQVFIKQTSPQLPYPYYQDDGVNIHGVSIIQPDAEWSVRHFQAFAVKVIARSLKAGRLPILIGGTGLYHDHVLETDSQFAVEPDLLIRSKAEQMTTQELQRWAERVSPERYQQMNRSDRLNPRRLVRVIEIGQADSSHDNEPDLAVIKRQLEQLPHQYIGIVDEMSHIIERIEARVKERFVSGAVEEVRSLKKNYQDWSSPAFTATGVQEVKQYLDGQLNKDECLQQWTRREVQYAKRQLTWWRGRSVNWFDVSNSDWKSAAEEYILKLCSKFSKTEKQ